ncbi:MAG: GtrA family protein [Pseudomonadales bacterium]|nr:GtrA family protein [Pseudomonadales bacterium]
MAESGSDSGLDNRLHRQLSRFLIVGAGGFVIDISVMTVLLYGVNLAGSDAELIGSRVIAWGAAISATYFLNARFTFGASIRHSRFLNYLVIQAAGACINLGTFAGLVVVGPFEQHPLVAMVIGNVLATINNFLLVRKFVYRFHPDVDDPD